MGGSLHTFSTVQLPILLSVDSYLTTSTAEGQGPHVAGNFIYYYYKNYQLLNICHVVKHTCLFLTHNSPLHGTLIPPFYR